MKNENDKLLNLILEIAQIPSFTTHEKRLHPFIQDYCSNLGLPLLHLNDGSILVETPGKGEMSVALSAHLDKNDYWTRKGEEQPEELNASINGENLKGLLDDAIGVGVCLYMIEQSLKGKFPPLKILFSECEEGFFKQYYTYETIGKLRNNGITSNGVKYSSGMGAQILSSYLMQKKEIPSALFVIDVTPLFDGEPGIALYSEPWEITNDKPTPELKSRTEKMESKLKKICPRIVKANNVNDYAFYGKMFSMNDMIVPCFALEPSIEYYHSPNEKVNVHDVTETVKILDKFLKWFPDNVIDHSCSKTI